VSLVWFREGPPKAVIVLSTTERRQQHRAAEVGATVVDPVVEASKIGIVSAMSLSVHTIRLVGGILPVDLTTRAVSAMAEVRAVIVGTVALGKSYSTRHPFRWWSRA
jgi:hypothetical protein